MIYYLLNIGTKYLYIFEKIILFINNIIRCYFSKFHNIKMNLIKFCNINLTKII